jgi:hypothetical protein
MGIGKRPLPIGDRGKGGYLQEFNKAGSKEINTRVRFILMKRVICYEVLIHPVIEMMCRSVSGRSTVLTALRMSKGQNDRDF